MQGTSDAHGPSEEYQTKLEALRKALEDAMRAGMASESLRRLRWLVLGCRMDILRWGPGGDLGADVEPLVPCSIRIQRRDL